jgi:hypothetical protein
MGSFDVVSGPLASPVSIGGHILDHCPTNWRRTGRKVQFQEIKFGNMNNSNEESCSRNLFNLLMIDSIPVSSTSSPNTSLHISVQPPKPASPPLLALEVAPVPPETPTASDHHTSKAMAYRHADPHLFTPVVFRRWRLLTGRS